jgi:hypothetical protein
MKTRAHSKIRLRDGGENQRGAVNDFSRIFSLLVHLKNKHRCLVRRKQQNRGIKSIEKSNQ